MAREPIDWRDGALHALEVAASEFVVVTASSADMQALSPLSALLQRVQRAFGIEAAFVSEWVRGALVVRPPSERGEAGALQSLYGMRLLDGGASMGTRFRFQAVPVVTREGSWHGTLCCRCPAPAGNGDGDESAHERALHSVARLIANWFDDAQLAAA